MARELSVLCIHGIGHGDTDPDLQSSWTNAVQDAFNKLNATASVKCDFLRYDSLFDHAPLNGLTYAGAIASLLASGVTHTIGDLFSRSRGLLDFPDKIRWTAGMVAQWATEDGLRDQARKAVLAKLAASSYDVICAHSLGSLICYDTFSRNPDAIDGKYFVTFGSQIGNPFVRDTFAGRIEPLPKATMWYHMFNPDDRVFTAEIRMNATNFTQVGTLFDIPNDLFNHDPAHYLDHPNAIDSVWRNICATTKNISGRPLARAIANGLNKFDRLNTKPKRRALLIGINDYPDPANRLEGCVNDVFLMSSVLQECNFDAEDIRVVLDDRATASGIRERLHWLLDDAKDGDERVLFYSGHGAQIPTYGKEDKVSQVDECLVPYDFDWTPERAITDHYFFELYSQLPYGMFFAAIFDCCHAGGMTREGGRKIRGLTPPDDIRHRALRWNVDLQMWEERKLDAESQPASYGRDFRDFVGQSGMKRRLGRAVELRTLSRRRYDVVRKAMHHQGPYLPVIMEACKEDQLASEYRHGVISYGAYTYCLAQVLRSRRARGNNPTFTNLTEEVQSCLHKLKYDQVPELVGPKSVVDQPIPWSKSQISRSAPAARKRLRK